MAVFDQRPSPMRPEGRSRRRFLRNVSVAAVAAGLPGATVFSQQSPDSGRLPDTVQALLFDVFGTVVDWHGSIVRQGELLSVREGYEVDWAAFATRWRSGYGPAMRLVRDGELPWTRLDVLHRMILDEMLPEFGLEHLSDAERAEINRMWHSLTPWPDTVAGLHRLRSRYIIAPLSNGNVSMLLNIARNAGLPWDAILSAELAEQYKPAPEAYLKAAELLDLDPGQIMLVAAHPGDLRAAAAQGFRTAYVYRPLERGSGEQVPYNTGDDFDLRVFDFFELSELLGA